MTESISRSWEQYISEKSWAALYFPAGKTYVLFPRLPPRHERIHGREEFMDIGIWIQLVDCLADINIHHFPLQPSGVGDGRQQP